MSQTIPLDSAILAQVERAKRDTEKVFRVL
jgi:hypothetical protein